MTTTDARLREQSPAFEDTAPLRTAGATAPMEGEGWRRTFASLSERDYAIYFAGNTSFFLAMQMNTLLRNVLAYDLTESAIAIAIVSVAMALPMLLIAPFGGVIADRVNKRTLLILTQTLVTVTNGIVTVLILADRVEFWHIAVSTLFLGIGISVAMPARNALVPQLIPQHKLMNAISLQMGGMNLTRIIGPAVGGLLIAPLGIGVVWAISVTFYLIATLSVLALPVHGMVAKAQSERFATEFIDGFRYIAATPRLRLLLLTGMVMPLFAFPVQMLLPVFQEEVFKLGEWSLGAMMAAAGLGGLVGALGAANLDMFPKKGRLLLVGAAVQGGFLLAFALTPVFVAALVFLALGNIGGMLFMTTNNSVIQAQVPERYRGRVMSMLMMSFGLMPFGVFPISIAIELWGAPAAVAGSSIAMIAVLALFFGWSRSLRELHVAPAGRAEMSTAQALRLVAEGQITREEAAQRAGVALEDLPASTPAAGIASGNGR